MKLFLDSSVLLAASGSETGSSRALFSYAHSHGWTLVSSPYALNEVSVNLGKLPTAATTHWMRLRGELQVADDIVSLDRPSLFAASKDRPILFTALASADVLLTLDKTHFADLFGGSFYGLQVMPPYAFLDLERDAGRLRVS